MNRLIGAFAMFYVFVYGAYRQTQSEVWPQDKRSYVIFPANFAGKTLYYFFRPLSLVDAAVTGQRFHIGPHT